MSEDIYERIREAKQEKSNILDLTAKSVLFLPPEIGDLVSLETLLLSGNSLKSLPKEIGNLRNLKKFEARYCNLSELPESFWSLRELQVLRLGDNRLTSISNSISNLNNLEHLSLWGNQLRVLPDGIFQLEKLKVLNLSDTGLESLSEAVGNLSKLELLNLEGNSLKHLPLSILKLQHLQKLYLHDNPLLIPPEILAKRDKAHEILAYVSENLTKKTRPVGEAKILVLGQGKVGKTSIIRRIVNGDFSDNEAKTEGIAIDCWQVENQSTADNQSSQIKLNIWDFGGQEIMHTTHQFFLTKRSIYLLVLDSRISQEQNQVEYWLKIIQSYGGDSPIIVIGNRIDEHPFDIDRTGLQKKYPNIIDVLETSAATGAGIEELKTAITEQVNNLSHVRDLLPETWFTIKTELEALGHEKNFITQDKYLELCAENEVSNETNQRTLIGFLHDLGVILHFQNDPRLESLGILNPQWVTNGVYKILNSHELFNNKGVLTLAMLNEILNIDGYPRDKRLFIVDLMKKFELCYNLEPDKSFLVPDLLPKDQPELKFNGIPALEYAYPVLPSSIITRFIVRMNQKIDEGTVWRTGVLLKIGDNHALVKADLEDRKITITIDGLEHTRRDALSAIRYQLDEIHTSIKGLNPQKRVPVPNAPNAEPIEYDYLLMLEREGQETHLVKDGTRLVKVNVREILSGIESETQRQETGGNVTNIFIGGNVEGSNIVSGDNNVITQRIQESFNKADSADIQKELKETLKELAEAVAKMNKELPKEQATEAADDLEKLVEEATKPKPNKKWYSVSIDGLIKAAENLDKLGEPVISLSKRVLSLLTGGVMK